MNKQNCTWVLALTLILFLSTKKSNKMLSFNHLSTLNVVGTAIILLYRNDLLIR